MKAKAKLLSSILIFLLLVYLLEDFNKNFGCQRLVRSYYRHERSQDILVIDLNVRQFSNSILPQEGHVALALLDLLLNEGLTLDSTDLFSPREAGRHGCLVHEPDLLPTRHFQRLENEVIPFEELREFTRFLLHGCWRYESFAVLRVGLVLAILKNLVPFVLFFDRVEVRSSAWDVVSGRRKSFFVSRLFARNLQVVLVDAVEAVGESALNHRSASSSEPSDERGSLALSLGEQRYLSGTNKAWFKIAFVLVVVLISFCFCGRS